MYTGRFWRGSARVSRPPATGQVCRVQDTSPDELGTPYILLLRCFVWGLFFSAERTRQKRLGEKKTNAIFGGADPWTKRGNPRQQAHKQGSHAAHLVDARCSVHFNGCRHRGPALVGGAAGLKSEKRPRLRGDGAGLFRLGKREGPQQAGGWDGFSCVRKVSYLAVRPLRLVCGVLGKRWVDAGGEGQGLSFLALPSSLCALCAEKSMLCGGIILGFWNFEFGWVVAFGLVVSHPKSLG